MKPNSIFKMSRSSRSLLAAVLAFLCAGMLNAQSFFSGSIDGISLGNASGGAAAGQHHWAIFALSGGNDRH